MNLESVQNYWQNPSSENAPETYGRWYIGRSLFLVDQMRELVDKDAKILELGCNVGRNLAFLFHGGFKKLSGIEINPTAVEMMKDLFPELKKAKITLSKIEDAITELADDSYDVIYSMAVLEHLHTDSDWVFAEMKRVARVIITIEDEHTVSNRHFPRCYADVFGDLGLVQTESLERVPGLPNPFRYRVFSRPSAE